MSQCCQFERVIDPSHSASVGIGRGNIFLHYAYVLATPIIIIVKTINIRLTYFPYFQTKNQLHIYYSPKAEMGILNVWVKYCVKIP